MGLTRVMRMRIVLVAMNYVTEISAIEARLKRAGKTVAELLRAADVSASQWQRWKNKHHEPHRTTWARIVTATERLTGEAPNEPRERRAIHPPAGVS